MTCDSIVINNLPAGLTNTKSTKMVPVSKEDPDKEEEYRVPVGGEVNLNLENMLINLQQDQEYLNDLYAE